VRRSGLIQERLRNQRLTTPTFDNAADVVAWMGAVQAQEYGPSRWGMAQRMAAGTKDADLVRAVEEGTILRTHVLRPTWHYVARDDIRWMLELTAPHVRRSMAAYMRQLGIDAAMLRRARPMLEKSLGGGHCLTRQELGERLGRARLPLKGTALALLVMNAELDGLICSGPYRAKKLTYGLVAERAPGARSMPRDEALGELARRFLQSHGTATVRDFMWWSGLPAADARRAIQMHRTESFEIDDTTYWRLRDVAPRSRVGRDATCPPEPWRMRKPPGESQAVAGNARQPQPVYLLPIYDEYVVAYRDRHTVPFGGNTASGVKWNGVTFQHSLIAGGQVAGTWRVDTRTGGVTVAVSLLRPLTRVEERALEKEVERYGKFLGIPATIRRGGTLRPA
jgi:hypothetical protein